MRHAYFFAASVVSAVQVCANCWTSQLVWLMMVVSVGGVLATEAFGQGEGRPGGRPGDIGHRDSRSDLRHQLPGNGNLGNPNLDPRENPNRPSVTLTLEPAGIYAGDEVTLRWRVSYPREPARQWEDPVHLSSTVMTLSRRLQDNAGSAGSHTFTAPAGVTAGNFTLTTGRACTAHQDRPVPGTPAARHPADHGPQRERAGVPGRRSRLCRQLAGP